MIYRIKDFLGGRAVCQTVGTRRDGRWETMCHRFEETHHSVVDLVRFEE